jgi:hypothetical protein
MTHTPMLREESSQMPLRCGEILDAFMKWILEYKQGDLLLFH